MNILFTLFIICIVSVSAIHIDNDRKLRVDSEEYRKRVLSPEGLIIENEWIATVDADKCKSVNKQIRLIKDKSGDVIADSLPMKATKIGSKAKNCYISFTSSVKTKREIAKVDGVKLVESNMVVVSTDVKSWGLDRVDQEDLPLDGNYNFVYDGDGADVYVLDTGVFIEHNDFQGRAVYGDDFINEGEETDLNGHGTHCAGTVGGRKYGVAKSSNIYGVKVLSGGGSGSYAGVIAGVEYAQENCLITNGKSSCVISMSLGGGSNSAMNNAVTDAAAAGMIVVVAAGNSDTDACGSSPAGAGGNGRNGGVITVGSTNSLDERSGFSNYGECVDIFAPGSSITSAWIGGNTDTLTISGTSMATPHVAGAAAGLLQAYNFDKNEAQNALFDLAAVDKISDVQGSPNLLLQIPMSGTPGPTKAPVPTVSPTQTPTAPPTTGAPTAPAPLLCIQDTCFEFAQSQFGPDIIGKIEVPGVFANDILCDDNLDNEDYTNKIVLVSRGDCFFHDKVYRAQSKGAVAVVIHMANDDPIFPPAFYDEDMTTIPSMMISLEDSETFKSFGEGTIVALGYPNGTPQPTQPTVPTVPTLTPTAGPSCNGRSKQGCKRDPSCIWKRRGRNGVCKRRPTSSPTVWATPSPTAQSEFCYSMPKNTCNIYPECVWKFGVCTPLAELCPDKLSLVEKRLEKALQQLKLPVPGKEY